MFEKEEQLLNDIKEQYEHLPIPSDIDSFISTGISKAQKRKQLRRRITFSTIAASMALFIFIGSIRTSPTFAKYVANIPGFSQIVELLDKDKGLQSALENGYFQSIGLSDEYEGNTFTLENITLDGEKMIVFYSHTGEELLRNLELYTMDNKKIDLMFAKWGIERDNTKNMYRMDFKANEEIPESMILKVPFESEDSNTPQGYMYEIPFTVDKNKFSQSSEVINLDKTIKIGEQAITFQDLTIHPTRTELRLKFDDNNNKTMFAFEDLRLIDKNEKEWMPTSYDSIIWYTNDNEGKITFESSFFEKPEELYLEFSAIRALDKDSLEVVVDMENEKILKAPDDKLSLLYVYDDHTSDGKGNWDIKPAIKFKMNEFEDKKITKLNFDYHDANGHNFSIYSADGTLKSNGEWSITLSPDEYKSPLTFKLVDYPARIYKDVRLKIK